VRICESLQFQTALCRQQNVGTHISGLAVEHQLEGILKQGLQHGRKLLICCSGRQCRLYIEVFGIEPALSRDLKILNPVRLREKILDGYVRITDAARASDHLTGEAALGGRCRWPDGSHLEGGPRGLARRPQ
jgi:hypothetical protein